MSRKNRFGNFMDNNFLYWVIGLIVFYYVFIRNLSNMPAPGAVKIFAANSKKNDKPI